MFKALYDLVEHDLPCGPKLSKFNTFMMFFSESTSKPSGLMSTKELFVLTNLCPSVIPQN